MYEQNFYVVKIFAESFLRHREFVFISCFHKMAYDVACDAEKNSHFAGILILLFSLQ